MIVQGDVPKEYAEVAMWFASALRPIGEVRADFTLHVVMREAQGENRREVLYAPSWVAEFLRTFSAFSFHTFDELTRFFELVLDDPQRRAAALVIADPQKPQVFADLVQAWGFCLGI